MHEFFQILPPPLPKSAPPRQKGPRSSFAQDTIQILLRWPPIIGELEVVGVEDVQTISDKVVGIESK